MTREELRNAINNACDIMRREGCVLSSAEGADYHGLHGAALVTIEAMTRAVLERAFRGEL